jgi:hypothetical protein
MFLPRRGLGARGAWFCALGVMLAGAGCEPASITDAHNQLARGPERIVSLAIPIVDDTETVAKYITDTVTTAGGLLGVRFDSTVAVGVGNKLRFNGVTSTRFKYDVPAAVFLAAMPVAVDTSYTLLSVEPRLTVLDTIVVDSGSISITTSNRMSVPVDFKVTLNGFRNGAGATLADSSTIPAGSGTYATKTLTFNLAGVTVTPRTANAALHLSFTPVAGDAALGDSCVIQSGSGIIVVRRLEGPLNPDSTPELTVAVADSQLFDSTQFDFGDLKEAMDSIGLNDAQLTFNNTSGAPIVLSNLTLSVDSLGTTITVPVADSGASTLTVARGQTNKVVTLQAGRLLTWVVHGALAGRQLAIVASGTAAVGDGASSTIRNTDQVSVGLAVGLDFTLPSGGVSFGRYGVTDGADLNTADQSQIAQHVDTAEATAVVTNGMPFGVQVRIALVPDSVADMPVDSAFTLPNRVELGPASVAAGAVDTLGRVTGTTVDTASVGMDGTESQVLLGKRFTAFVKILLLPSAGSTRGAVRPGDKVIIHAKGLVQLRSGGTP